MKILAALIVATAIGLVTGLLVDNWPEVPLETLVKEAERNAARHAGIDKENQPWGIWVGTLPISSPGNPPVHRTLQLCLVKLPDWSRVFFLENKKWNEFRPGTFKTSRHGPTSILSSLSWGNTLGGGEWVEAWTFSVTQSSANTLVTSATRIVNNLKVQTPEAAFSFQGQAVLRRAPRCR